MVALCVHLLGPFQVFRNERLLEGGGWRSQQTRTILELLLVCRGRVVTSDQLIDLLWPGDDPQAARRHLHVRISQLRRALDPGRPSAYVLTVEGGYTFNGSAECWLDVDELEAGAAHGRRCQESDNLAEAIDAYEAARALYRGDLLEEDLYEDWAHAERERLREQHLTVLTELAECYAQQGRYRRAIACCRQVLVADPCREAAYVRLMLYHYYAGEQTQALQAYERCRQALAGELGLEPLPATTALADQIRGGTLWAVEGAPRYPPPAYEGRLFQVPYSLGHAPFVGREREYAWLVERWRSMRRGVLLVEGGAGVGKTRLVLEFLGFAEAAGAIVLRSRAAAAEALPFAPVVAALRSLPSLWEGDELDEPIQAALAPLFPELRERNPDLPPLPELPAAQERERLLRAVEALVRARIPAGAILFVDDAQRADPCSLALLARLAGHLVVVLTCRSEEMPSEHPLRTALRPLGREGGLARLALGRLPADAVRTLIRRLGGAGLPALDGRLIAKTGGNPLFLIASLQHLFEEGNLYLDASGAWAGSGDPQAPLPPTVRQAVEARLRALSRDQRRVFDLAAVAGGEVDSMLLQKASEMAEDPLLEALDGLLEAGLLVEPRAAGRAELALGHDCYGEVAYETLPQVRRRRLHRCLAEALAATTPDADGAAPAVARHFELGGQPAQAFEWLLRAGEAAQARYAHEEALAFYRRATALEGGETAQVWERMGRIAHHLARFDDGVRFHEHALLRWQALGDVVRQVQARYALAECHRELSRFDRAAGQARAGLAMAEDLGDESALLARGHIILSNALRSGQLGPAAAVEEHLERALELARPVEEWGLVGEATFWLGVVAINRGDASRALAYDRQALAHFRRTGQAGWEAIAHNNTAYHALLAGQPRLALQTAEAGLALARRVGALNTQGWLLSTLGEVQAHLGQLEEARLTLDEGLTLVTQWGPPRLRPGFLADLGRVAIARRDWEGALACLHEALALAPEIAPQFVPRLRVYLGQAYSGLGDLQAAEEQALQAQQAAEGKGQRSVEGQAWRILGAVRAETGREPEAEEAFACSLELLQAVGDELEAGRTQAAWGKWLHRRGDGRAGGCLDAARSTFQRCESAVDLAGEGWP